MFIRRKYRKNISIFFLLFILTAFVYISVVKKNDELKCELIWFALETIKEGVSNDVWFGGLNLVYYLFIQ